MRSLLFLLLLFPLIGIAQTTMCVALDPIVHTIQRIDLYNTDDAQARIADLDLSSCAQADSLHELAPQLIAVMNAMDDHHGHIMLDGRPIAWMTDDTYTNRDDQRAPDQQFWSEVQQGRYGYEASMRGKNIGYLRIPAVNGGDLQETAQRFRHGLDSLVSAGAERWIIDLRVNSGGNMWPMLEALSPLFPEGRAATTVDRHDGLFAAYEFHQGHFERDAYRMIELPVGADRSQDPVVVLAGRYTASSGEAVAACSIDRAKLFIGETTAGYATETGWTVLYDRVALSISESVFIGPDASQFRHGIGTTIEIPQPKPTFDEEDPAIKAALAELIER